MVIATMAKNCKLPRMFKDKLFPTMNKLVITGIISIVLERTKYKDKNLSK